jgi:hypothetical protein
MKYLSMALIRNVMRMKRLIPVVILLTWIGGIHAQGQRFMVKITDAQNQTALVENATSSSSSSCNTSDFPVMQGGSRTDINFRDLNRIIVHPDRSTKNDEVYVAVELVNRDGASSMTEMIRSIRFMGDTGDGRYRKKIEDIRSVEVLF